MTPGRELLTASRMGVMLACPRRHYWAYEVGLRPVGDAYALRFGSAWHRAMESRWRGESPEDALAAAIGEGPDLDELAVATVAALLGAYFSRYAGEAEVFKALHPEVEFETFLPGSRTFRAAGKIDGLGVLHDGRLALCEHKTAGESIDHDSAYWLKLRANAQVFQYVLAARALGWNVTTVVYDVTRKPSISPRHIPLLDADGCKVVLDNETGERVFLANGKPRQSAGDGMTLQTREESPEEFGDRLSADAQARPDFYFARREVPVLDQDLEEFREQQVQVSRMILGRRREQRKCDRPERAWPRNVGTMTCTMCPYSDFCLQGISVDPSLPPAGFRVGTVHEELTNQGGEAA